MGLFEGSILQKARALGRQVGGPIDRLGQIEECDNAEREFLVTMLASYLVVLRYTVFTFTLTLYFFN